MWYLATERKTVGPNWWIWVSCQIWNNGVVISMAIGASPGFVPFERILGEMAGLRNDLALNGDLHKGQCRRYTPVTCTSGRSQCASICPNGRVAAVAGDRGLSGCILKGHRLHQHYFTLRIDTSSCMWSDYAVLIQK